MRLPTWLSFVVPSNWPSLRARMTISYVVVTLGSVLSFILLGALARSVLITLVSVGPSQDFSTAVQQQAQSYALLAGLQAQGEALDPRTNFISGQAHSIAYAYQDSQHPGWSLDVFARYIPVASTDPASVATALLVAPDGRVEASSYPARY